eukprot:Em0005g398a
MLAAMLEAHTFCLTSTLSVVVTSAMNGLVVSCSSYSQASATTTPVGNATISVVGYMSACLVPSIVTSLPVPCGVRSLSSASRKFNTVAMGVQLCINVW